MAKCSYLDPLQNHKYDDRIIFKDDEVKMCPSKHQHLMQMARSLGTHGKHVGSKPLKSLINAIRQQQETTRAVENAVKKLTEEDDLSKEQ